MLAAQQPNWTAAISPTLAEFERLADSAFAALPEEFRRLCAGLVIRIEDFPDDETLEAMECESDFDLLGLFRGRGLVQQGSGPFTGELPNMIWLYRRPIIDYWSADEEPLGAIVTHVLVHEIGHHVGLSDADIAAIERAA